MDITPHLAFDGTCEEAFAFYAATLGERVEGRARRGGIGLVDVQREAARGLEGAGHRVVALEPAALGERQRAVRDLVEPRRRHLRRHR